MTQRKTDETADEAVRAKIMMAIQECDDKSMKVVLLMMLEILDSISRKIDAVMRDEESIRELVLNGDSATHAQDHRDWRAFSAEWGEISPAVGILKERHIHGGYCTYALRKMDEEQKEAASRRVVRDGWVTHVAWALTTIIVLAVYSQYFGLR